jgi:hypothetical protein
MEDSTSHEMKIPFSYSNTCGLGLDMFDACDCGRKYASPKMIEQLPTPASTPLPHIEPVRTAKKNPKSQSKPLLFINHDAKHLKSQATRSQVTSHLRSAYEPWKHRMQARARRQAGKLAINAKSSTTSTEQNEVSFLQDFSGRQPRRNSKIQLAVTEDSISHVQSLIPAPQFYQGNSDPFSSLSIQITPLIAELIKFEHAHLHPCIYSTKNAPTRAYGTSYLADMHGPAANQAAVYGYLSRAAIVLSSVSQDPRFKTAALALKGRSSALLRKQLADGGEGKGDIPRKILALMIAELFAHEYAAAEVHSRMLMGLLEARSQAAGQREEFDMRFFFSVVYSEVQRSCMSLTRPCFDASKSGWVSRLFESVGGDAFRSLVETMEIDDKPLEPSVLGIELAEIFGDVRTVRKVSEQYSNSPRYGTATPLALYLPARVVLCLGRMIRFYMDHCAGREVWDLLPRELIHRAAVLGALFWVRKAGHIDSIRVSSTSTIYSAGPMVLKRLRESLRRFDGIASPREGELYAGLRFWVLYIGAQEEQGRERKGEVVDKWFTVRLVEASIRIGICTWQQAQPILERYPHPDAAEPHGSTWFSELFSDISLRRTDLGGSFPGFTPADTMADLGKVELGGKMYGSGDDYMTWSTEEPMGLETSEMTDEDLTCMTLNQSVQPALVFGTKFTCPSWDIGQEKYWDSVSASHEMGMLGNEGTIDTSSAVSANGSGGRSAGRQSILKTPASKTSEIKAADPVMEWIGKQEQAEISSITPAKLAYRYSGISLDANTTTKIVLPMSQSHLFHSSAPCWQNDCTVHQTEAKPHAKTVVLPVKNVHRYTSQMNDPKLTGVETGPVAFVAYPVREMDEAEALAEARKYEFF